MKVLPITQLGQPVLRRTARPIPASRIRRLEPFVRQMLATMKKAQGVGIAANQVGKSLRVFIVAPEPSVRYPHAPRIPPIPMINPQLIKASRTMKTDWEGCLSVPGIRGQIPRHTRIVITFTDLLGKHHRAELSGFIARIFQHEFDHINGRVFLDRVRDTRTLITEFEYRKRLA